MKFPVLWLASVSLSVWVGTEKGVRLVWDLVSRSRITLHLGAKAVKPKQKNQNHFNMNVMRGVCELFFQELIMVP